MTLPVTGTLAIPLVLQPSPIEDPENEGQYLTVQEAILTAIRGGNTHEDAAVYAGIAPRTLGAWIKRGLDTLNELSDTDPEENQATACENPYVLLATEILRADTQARMGIVGNWVKQTSRDWRGAQAFLAVRYGGQWAQPEKVQVTGPNGGPVQHQVESLDHGGAEKLLERLVERRRAVETIEADSTGEG